MRAEFPGYYSPSKADFAKLWADGLIVLDTNVLLYLYKVPSSTRADLLKLLAALKDRIWIPYHVALEFQKNRLTAIASENKLLQDVLIDSDNCVETIAKKVKVLDLDKRDIGADPDQLLKTLADAHKAIVDALKKAQEKQVAISHQDSVRDVLDKILTGRIGPPPASQEELDSLVADGELRFARKVPPGFKDAGKERSENDAMFVSGGICYQRKFGDLILWRQLISHLKVNELKRVMIVTEDTKDDWWLRLQGKTIGPHPELMSELRREAGVELAWGYSLLQFIEHANNLVTGASKVSPKSISEVKQAVEQAGSRMLEDQANWNFTRHGLWNESPSGSDELGWEGYAHLALPSVHQWLMTKGWVTEQNLAGFPDLIGSHPYRFGVQVDFLRHLVPLSSSKSVVSLLRARESIKSGQFSAFFLVLVLDPRCLQGATFFKVQEALEEARSLEQKYGVEVFVGSVIFGKFELLSDGLVERVKAAKA